MHTNGNGEASHVQARLGRVRMRQLPAKKKDELAHFKTWEANQYQLEMKKTINSATKNWIYKDLPNQCHKKHSHTGPADLQRVADTAAVHEARDRAEIGREKSEFDEAEMREEMRNSMQNQRMSMTGSSNRAGLLVGSMRELYEQASAADNVQRIPATLAAGVRSAAMGGMPSTPGRGPDTYQRVRRTFMEDAMQTEGTGQDRQASAAVQRTRSNPPGAPARPRWTS
eukprot:917433-Amphidinium_carterae.6